MLHAPATPNASFVRQDSVFKAITFVRLALLERSFQARIVYHAQALVKPAQMTLSARLVRLAMGFRITSAPRALLIRISVGRIALVKDF